MPYAAEIRAGRRRPHPRHWQALAKLAGISSNAGESLLVRVEEKAVADCKQGNQKTAKNQEP
jgi:hypothetical protein